MMLEVGDVVRYDKMPGYEYQIIDISINRSGRTVFKLRGLGEAEGMEGMGVFQENLTFLRKATPIPQRYYWTLEQLNVEIAAILVRHEYGLHDDVGHMLEAIVDSWHYQNALADFQNDPDSPGYVGEDEEDDDE